MSDGTKENSQGHCGDKRGVEWRKMALGSVVVSLVSEMALHPALNTANQWVLKRALMAILGTIQSYVTNGDDHNTRPRQRHLVGSSMDSFPTPSTSREKLK